MYDIDLNECPEWVELSTLMNETIPEMENQHFRLAELSKTLREGKVNREIAECLLNVDPNAFDTDEYPLGMFSESLSATNHEVVLKGWGQTLAKAAGSFGDMPVKMAALLIAVIIWVFSRIKKLFSGGSSSSGGASKSAKKKVAQDKGISESEAERELSKVFDRETEKLGNNNIALYVKGNLKAEDKVIKKCVENAVDQALQGDIKDTVAYNSLVKSTILEGNGYSDSVAAVLKDFSRVIVEMIGMIGGQAFARSDWKNEEIKLDANGRYRGFIYEPKKGVLQLPFPVAKGKEKMGGDTDLAGEQMLGIIAKYCFPSDYLYSVAVDIEKLNRALHASPGYDHYFKQDGYYFGGGEFFDPNATFNQLIKEIPRNPSLSAVAKNMASQTTGIWFGDKNAKDRANKLRVSDVDKLLVEVKGKLNEKLIGFKNGSREHADGSVFAVKDLTEIEDGLSKLEKYQTLLKQAIDGKGVVYYDEDEGEPHIVIGKHAKSNLRHLQDTQLSIYPLYTVDGDKEVLDVDKYINECWGYRYGHELSHNVCKELTDIARRLTGAVRNHAVFIKKLDDLLGNDPAITSDI